jgi:hypothetical protein
VDPQPPHHLRDTGLGCSRFARHYYGNHSLFSFPQGTEMFHFPWFARSTLCIQIEVPQLFTAVGFPIRTSPDQRLVGNSPKLFAATHVLHRLLAPRHPPHALSSLLTSISRRAPRFVVCRSSRSRSRSLLFAADPTALALHRPSFTGWRRNELSLSLKLKFYPSYALVNERSRSTTL